MYAENNARTKSATGTWKSVSFMNNDRIFAARFLNWLLLLWDNRIPSVFPPKSFSANNNRQSVSLPHFIWRLGILLKTWLVELLCSDEDDCNCTFVVAFVVRERVFVLSYVKPHSHGFTLKVHIC